MASSSRRMDSAATLTLRSEVRVDRRCQRREVEAHDGLLCAVQERLAKLTERMTPKGPLLAVRCDHDEV
eukprot:SAG31_NODE_6564_length_1973_cov_1.761473_2_plen_68_part_01